MRGALTEPAGRHPAGSTYRADSPELLLWILACLADSAQAACERFVRGLSPSERERFWEDYLVLGELFGLPRSEAPPDYRGYRACMRERLASDDLHVLPQAREIGLQVAFELPLPASPLPTLPAINLAVVGLLPQRVRSRYGLRWTPVHALTLESHVRVSRTLRPFTPHAARPDRQAVRPRGAHGPGAPARPAARGVGR